MSTETKKTALNSFLSYSINDFITYIESRGTDRLEEIEYFLEKLFLKEGIIIPHLLKEREERDKFFARLNAYLSHDEYFDPKQYFTQKLTIINSVEQLIDSIKSSLNNLDIARLKPNEQIWIHISHCMYLWDFLDNKMSEYLDSIYEKPDKYHYVGAITLSDADGRKYNPDTLNELIVNYLSLTLSMLAYNNDWYVNEKIMLPKGRTGEMNSDVDADKTMLLASSWIELLDIGYRTLLFGGTVEIVDNVKKISENESITLRNYKFEKNHTHFEIYDFLSNTRLNNKILQNYVEIISETDVMKKIVGNITDIKSLTDNLFLSPDEATTMIALCEIYNYSVKEDISTHGGLTLLEWVRGYSLLKYLNSDSKNGAKWPIITYNDLLGHLTTIGFSSQNAKLFIEKVTFAKSSRDLFDCPLILTNEDSYFIVSNIVKDMNIVQIIMSRLSSLKDQDYKKGPLFEQEMIKYLKEHDIICDSLKYSIDSEKYEYDVIFILDSKVFILECKNRGLSRYNSVSAKRKERFLNDTTKQLKRLLNGLNKYPKAINDKFKIDIADYEVIPVIMNCLPFSWGGKYNDVYISDSSAFRRLFQSNELSIIAYQTIEGIKIKQNKVIRTLWSGDRIGYEDVLKQFESPFQIDLLLKYLTIRYITLPVSDNTTFSIPTFHLDHEREREDVDKLFSNGIF